MRHEYEREETSAATKLTYLLVGGGIGAILALLFAPKSGEELRGDIADATRKGIERARKLRQTCRKRQANITKFRVKRRASFTKRLRKRPVISQKSKGSCSSYSESLFSRYRSR
ncbi:MAG: YtxH domain-containing protein [Acidobacteria bacterium]|nr:YtxH domain-containing protein [Acidobacteriota bacterium]